MSLSDILKRISELVGRFTGTSPNAERFFLREVAVFIMDHKLILFFVLTSFLFAGVSLLRRMIKS